MSRQQVNQVQAKGHVRIAMLPQHSIKQAAIGQLRNRTSQILRRLMAQM
ncbi:MAG: hypothetical protein ACXVDN_20335 [Ktedonobacteraceae bacterium]